MSQNAKAIEFRSLHNQNDLFVIANAFDGGSARMLAKLGLKALATSSAACSGTVGNLDGSLTRDEALRHARAIASATERPVSADLENGFGRNPAEVAETVKLAADVGLVGCSIDDSTGDSNRPQDESGLAIERVSAAVTAARALPLPFSFTLTARAENFVYDDPDLAVTISRLQAF